MEKVWLMRIDPYDDIFVLRERSVSAILNALFCRGYLSIDDVTRYSEYPQDVLEEILEVYFETSFVYE